jgi:hypothetical protein
MDKLESERYLEGENICRAREKELCVLRGMHIERKGASEMGKEGVTNLIKSQMKVYAKQLGGNYVSYSSLKRSVLPCFQFKFFA